MIENTKITLSAKELELVCNTDWILTKQLIIQKVYELFGTAATGMQQKIYSAGLTGEVTNSPKISKGENYQNLPYVMLDYPRDFGKQDTMAVRTFFWWGNFCSVTLLLAGSYKESASKNLLQQFAFLQDKNYFVCISNTEWEHHFEADNFVSVRSVSVAEFEDIFNRQSFVKIAKKIPLQEWDKISSFIQQSFTELMPLLPAKHPGGGKDLLPGIPTTDSDL